MTVPVQTKQIQGEFLKALRTQTSPYHESLEKAGLADKLMNNGLTVETYKNILKIFYGFIIPLEAYYYSEQNDVFPGLTEYKRGDLLRRDLLFLGLSESDLVNIPRFSEAPYEQENYIMGTLYVLEGSKLGGQIISKRVKEALNFSSEEGTLFFSAHGHQTGHIWKEFIDVLCTYAVKNLCEEEIISGAKQTFSDFEKWIRKSEFSQ